MSPPRLRMAGTGSASGRPGGAREPLEPVRSARRALARAARSPAVASLACVLVAGVWLNQSVGLSDWEAIRDRVWAAPRSHLAEAARYPFVFLYRRPHDEEIYYATASAIVGRPFRPDYLDRGAGADAFSHVPVTDDGKWRLPYAQVPLEYPPLLVAFMLLPRLVASTFLSYARLFGASMAACLVAAFAAALRAFGGAGAGPPAARARRWWLASCLLLAHGAIAVQRLDAVVALLLALALKAGVRRRPLRLGVWMGLAAAAKILPAALFPIAIAADWPFFRKPGNLAKAAGGAALAFAAGFAPLVALGGLPHFLAYHGERGLHVESTPGILYAAALALAGKGSQALLDHGSFNLTGAGPALVAKIATPLAAAATAAVAIAIARAAPASREDAVPDGNAPDPIRVQSPRWKDPRTPGDPAGDEPDPIRVQRLATAMIAGCACIWLTGKVLSPQYLTWIIPLAIVVSAAPGSRIAWTFGAALVVGQIYWRGYYDDVYMCRPLGILTVLTRQTLLFAVFVIALRASAFARRRRVAGAAADSPSP